MHCGNCGLQEEAWSHMSVSQESAVTIQLNTSCVDIVKNIQLHK